MYLPCNNVKYDKIVKAKGNSHSENTFNYFKKTKIIFKNNSG